MTVFTTSLITVGIMLAYCVPGFILVKAGQIKEDHIPTFSRVLLYAFQPFLYFYLLIGKDNSKKTLINIGWFALAVAIMLCSFIFIFYMIFRKKMDKDKKYRIYTISTCLSNCSFMGVPLLEALLPGTDAALYSAVFSIVMNVLGWTVVSAIISGDRSYIKPKKILFNPLTFSLALSLPLFFAGVTLPAELNDMVNLMGRMTTPFSMLIIGMRLGTVKFREFLFEPMQYLIIAIKMLIFPAAWAALSLIFPLPAYLSDTLLIMCCCPAASIVLNFSEFVGKGQKTAVNLVLLSTLLSIVTLPVMLAIFM